MVSTASWAAVDPGSKDLRSSSPNAMSSFSWGNRSASFSEVHAMVDRRCQSPSASLRLLVASSTRCWAPTGLMLSRYSSMSGWRELQSVVEAGGELVDRHRSAAGEAALDLAVDVGQRATHLDELAHLLAVGAGRLVGGDQHRRVLHLLVEVPEPDGLPFEEGAEGLVVCLAVAQDVDHHADDSGEEQPGGDGECGVDPLLRPVARVEVVGVERHVAGRTSRGRLRLRVPRP